MGIVGRQSIKTTIVSYTGVILGAANLLYLSTLFLSPEEIGLTKAIMDVASIFVPFIMMGTVGIILKFHAVYESKENHKKEFHFLIHLIPLIGFIIFIACFYLFNDFFKRKFNANSGLFIEYQYLIVVFSAILVVRSIYVTLANANLRIVVPKLMHDVVLRCLIMVIIILYGLKLFDQRLFFNAYFAMQFIVLIPVIIYSQRLNKTGFSFKFSNLSSKEIKSMLEFGSYSVLFGIGSTIVMRIDSLMITSLIGLEQMGIYAIALYIGNVVEIPRKAITQISIPLISKAWHNENYKVISSLYQKSALNLLFAGALVFIVIWTNIDNLFNLIPNGAIYQQGKMVILFIGLAKLFDMAMGVNGEILMMSKHYRVNIPIYFILIISAIVSNYLLIPIYGIVGASMATALSILIFNLIRFSYLLKTVHIQPFTIKTIQSLFLLLIVFSVGYYFPSFFKKSIFVENDFEILNILLRATITTITAIALFYFGNISEDLNRLFLGIKKKIIG